MTTSTTFDLNMMPSTMVGICVPLPWYVSSWNGSDSNDGRTPLTPLQTIDRLQDLYQEGDGTVFLECGSTFLEEFVDFPVGITVESYGIGERPIIDGAGAATNGAFVKTAGRTNVYQYSVSHNFGAASLAGQDVKHRAWEDGSMLSRAGSLAACDSTAGTFYAAAPTLGPDLVYVHPRGSTNPISDGKLYEFSEREFAIRLDANILGATIRGLHGKRNAHGNGGIKIDGYATDCYATQGWKHCFFLRSGRATDCVAQYIEPPDAYGGATMFVHYEDAHSTSLVEYVNCQAIADDVMVASSGALNSNVTLGFYGHTDGPVRFDTVSYTGCDVQGCVNPYALAQCVNVDYENCTSTGAQTAFVPYATNVTIIGGTHLAASGANTSCVSFQSDFQLPATLVMRGVGWYSAGDPNFPLWINVGDVVRCQADIQYCTFVGSGGFNCNTHLQNGDFTFKHNILCGFSLRVGEVGDPATYDGNYNLFYNLSGFADANVHYFYLGSESITIAVWKAAHPTFDQNSVEQNPLFTGTPSAGDFTISDASPAVAIQAGLTFYEAE